MRSEGSFGQKLWRERVRGKGLRGEKELREKVEIVRGRRGEKEGKCEGV